MPRELSVKKRSLCLHSLVEMTHKIPRFLFFAHKALFTFSVVLVQWSMWQTICTCFINSKMLSVIKFTIISIPWRKKNLPVKSWHVISEILKSEKECLKLMESSMSISLVVVWYQMMWVSVSSFVTWAVWTDEPWESLLVPTLLSSVTPWRVACWPPRRGACLCSSVLCLLRVEGPHIAVYTLRTPHLLKGSGGR